MKPHTDPRGPLCADHPTAARHPAPARRSAVAAVLVLLAAVLAGCGYTVVGQQRSGGARTVAIRVVGNETYRQRYELPLTRQLQEQLPILAGLTPVGTGSADTVLDVTLVEVTNRSLAGGAVLRDASGRSIGRVPVVEGGLELAADVVWRDARSGAVLRSTRVFDRAEYRIPVDETEAGALGESSFDLGRKIALALEEPF